MNLIFGPKLLNKKTEYFIKKWQRELEALYHIKSKLKHLYIINV
ncbi:tRNA (adenine(22)-N(1))-methyltransferase TrmK [Staphylococcus aureus]